MTSYLRGEKRHESGMAWLNERIPRKRKPKKRWMDTVKMDCKERELSAVKALRAAQDRQVWRTVLKRRQSVLRYRQGAKRRKKMYIER